MRMKSISTFICLLLLLPVIAQYDGKDPDVASRFRPGIMWFNTGWRPAKENSGPKYDRLMVDLSYNDWVNDSALFLVKPSSIGFNIHTMWDIPLAARNTVGLGIGLSYRCRRVNFNGLLIRNAEHQATTWQLYSGSTGPDKSIFTTHAFAIPVELRLRTPKWKHVKFHLGAHVGYTIQAYTKVRLDGNKSKTKDKSFFDYNPFFYGVHARFGIRNWAFFADYSFTKQFRSEKSTDLRPLTFGITLSLF